MSELPVSEVFGPTWQGEGPYAGTRTGFVRLGRCNLSCEWCDTPYTWDATRYDVDAECPDTPVHQVLDQLDAMGVDTVCLSGGEPLLHRAKLDRLLVGRWEWHAETNGTIPPPQWWGARVRHTSVSPKLNTRDRYSRRIRPLALRQWAELAASGLACFKFVVAEPAELDQVAELTGELGIAAQDVWIMPLGTTPDELIERHAKLAQAIEDHGWNTTTRLHILLYGSERRR